MTMSTPDMTVKTERASPPPASGVADVNIDLTCEDVDTACTAGNVASASLPAVKRYLAQVAPLPREEVEALEIGAGLRPPPGKKQLKDASDCEPSSSPPPPSSLAPATDAAAAAAAAKSIDMSASPAPRERRRRLILS